MKKNVKNRAIIGLVLISIIVVGGEIYLRTCLGMTHAPLYEESSEWEYMAKANQDGIRFNNHYHYNSYRQRSEEPDSTKNIVLGLGDSVIFGGVLVDQKDIATSLFGEKMPGWQMLNISAGSWGPDNCAAYLKHYGLFNAKAMFLVVSSHDAHDNMDFKKIVGKHVTYPAEHFSIGWIEFLYRYVWPRTIGKLFKGKTDLDPDKQVLAGTGIRKKGLVFNAGFDQLKAMADSANIPLFVYLHPDVLEFRQHKYSEQGEEIIKWAKDNNIKLIKELDYNFVEEDYRDGIHQTATGQKKMADIMVETISRMVD